MIDMPRTDAHRSSERVVRADRVVLVDSRTGEEVEYGDPDAPADRTVRVLMFEEEPER